MFCTILLEHSTGGSAGGRLVIPKAVNEIPVWVLGILEVDRCSMLFAKPLPTILLLQLDA